MCVHENLVFKLQSINCLLVLSFFSFSWCLHVGKMEYVATTAQSAWWLSGYCSVSTNVVSMLDGVAV